MKSQAVGTFMRSLLDNEMQAASEAGSVYNIPTLLADQNITLTNARMKETFVESLRDLASLQLGKLLSDLNRARKIVLTPALRDPNNGRQLGLSDYLDPALILGAPVSLVRYPLAIVIKSPLTGALILSSCLYALVDPSAAPDVGFIDTSAGDTASVLAENFLELVQTLLTVAVETAVVGRTFLVCLLEERNVVLADNIRRACREAGEGQSVVAVLGAAHLNGVTALLSNGE